MTRVHVGVTLLALAMLAPAYQDKGKEKKAEEPPKLRGTLPPNFKKLGLRDDQVQAIYKTRADYRAKIDQLNKQIAKLREEEKEALDKVLTAEQRKRLKEIRTGGKGSDKADK